MKKSILFSSITGIMLLLGLHTFAQNTPKADLKATIAGVAGGEISKNELLNEGLIQCSDLNYEIVSFSLSAVRNGDLFTLPSIENALTEQMKQLINIMEPGSKLFIEEIVARSADEKTMKLPAIVLTIK